MEKKEAAVLALRMLVSAIVNKEKEKRYKISKEKQELKDAELEKESRLTDEEILEVIASEAKKRKESIAEFEKGGREDLVQKEKAELEVLQKYLPEQLAEDELRKLAKEAVDKVGAKEMKDMGRVMQELMQKVKGRADGTFVSKVVKELLGEQR
ncbi:MAG: hypothetical protein G01um101430_272 [Parcubacteria group bacterium Gr01-1014_30]|nr:MAG: hypothetical protein G01um101430_272 [Parcubacteria group bacterium Gr01-1014_30]